MTDALIERLEAASGPDRELDGLIAIQAGNAGANSEGATNVRLDPDDDGWLLFEIGDEDCCNPIPEFTASLDAAMTLVPGGWGIDFKSPASGHLEQLGIETPRITTVRLHQLPKDAWATASTPALAFCIAALKALRAQAGEKA